MSQREASFVERSTRRVASTARPVLNSRHTMPRAKTPKKAPPSKSDFIRAQPPTLSAAEVLAKAKAAGLKLTSQLVYKVRSGTKPKGSAKKTSAPTQTSASTKPPTSKAAFVRGLPAGTAAKEVVKLAKAAGIRLDVGYVYNVRGTAKRATKKKGAAAKSPAVSTIASTAAWSVAKHAETLLRAVAAEIGLGRAIDLLHDERARVHSIVRE